MREIVIQISKFDETLPAGVWVGRDDNPPIGDNMTGSQAALPIWMNFMQRTQPGQ